MAHIWEKPVRIYWKSSNENRRLDGFEREKNNSIYSGKRIFGKIFGGRADCPHYEIPSESEQCKGESDKMREKQQSI